MAIKVVHIMADGTIRDSMKGVVVPKEQSEFAYKLLCEIQNSKKETDLELTKKE